MALARGAVLTFLLMGILAGAFAPATPTGKKTMSVPSRRDYLLGKYRASRHPEYRKVRKEYTDGNPRYLLKEVALAYEKMAEAARKDGIPLYIVSGFRSFARQKQIWDGKFNGARLVEGKNLQKEYPQSPGKRIQQILRYSAVPGTSRHHWGTDFDLNSVEPEYFETAEGLAVFNWLEENAARFGFFRPYNEGRSRGYQPEKWHWTYQPMSSQVLAEFQELIKPGDLQGYEGAGDLPPSLYEDYVLGINRECL